MLDRSDVALDLIRPLDQVVMLIDLLLQLRDTILRDRVTDQC